ncbi:MAG: thioesterase family protein [Gammaproteobacteria bacterium]
MSAAAPPPNGIVTSEVTVLPDWLDYNGHMNVAYYLVAFETGIDAYKARVGMDLAYIEREGHSTVALEAHITYQREAMLDDVLRVETRIVDCDAKRAHIYQELYREQDLLATQETMAISFDTAARRSCPFPEAIAANYRALMEAQAVLPRPAWLGRSIGIGKGRPGN